MCNQAVSLAAAAIERQGIATVTLILLRQIAERVRPPRTLALPFPHGFPLGRPNDPPLQRSVLAAALALLSRQDLTQPAIVDFQLDEARDPRGGSFDRRGDS